ncbi:MAG: hypothetical protein HYS32_04365 [Candidatus Woesearchaeota archaeon]|nr:MAG: hypothetical protein HYS32_04365 [Candidatus Woesearchaeota archaeon]
MLTKEDTKKILAFVKKEPKLIQDISHHIGKSWVTTDSYVNSIAKESGLIQVKTFREGTKGAIKVAYWNYAESLESDEIKEKLFDRIRLLANKKDFDPMEIYQFVDNKKAKAFIERYDDPFISKNQKLVSCLKGVESELFCFSGNLSWINVTENKVKIIAVLEELLKRGVIIRVLCRIDVASLTNLNIMERLMKKYPNQIEIRHRLQPLRGFIFDSKRARFKDEKSPQDFKGKELEKNVRMFYDIYDDEWIKWLQNVFWNLFRSSIDYKQRLEIINKIYLK